MMNTSTEALHVADRTAAQRRTTALNLIAQHGGLTADEVAGLMQLTPLAMRPRIAELHKLKLIEKTGERRTNASKMKANVWRQAVAA